MKYKNRTIATIDLGTNSILLLVVQRNEHGQVKVLHEGSEVVRLGEGLRQSGMISEQALNRTVMAIQEYQQQISPFKPEKIYLTATSAMREASNRDQIIEAIKSKTSLEVELIEKVEEARLTYKSVTSEEPHEDPSLVIDIGGGSTEVAWGIGSRYDGGRSLNIGTVKLIEGPLSKDVPTKEDLQNAKNEIDAQLARVTPLGNLDHYYGTAGSFTQAAAIDMKLATYSSQAVDHYSLKRENVQNWVNQLAEMTLEQRKALPGADPKRIDVMLAGMIIIERLFNKFQNPEFIVRDRGIKFGKAFDQFRDFEKTVLFS